MTVRHSLPINALLKYLLKRRSSILRAWRKASDADHAQTTAHSLTHRQFDDHIPGVLDSFALKLRARLGGASDTRVEGKQEKEHVKHGLHRWQQGYRMEEVMKEWWLLQVCLSRELDVFVGSHPSFPRALLGEFNLCMMSLVNESLRESAAQFERLKQAEAASRANGLQTTLKRLQTIEHQRSTLIHQAVHDIHSSAFSVRVAANVLKKPSDDPDKLSHGVTLLHNSVQGVTSMLDELLELARLEAGHDIRRLTAFDVSALVRSVATVNQPIAQARGLRLTRRGPRLLLVEGDEIKVRRLMQNLVSNALKYTFHGSVKVSWGTEKKSWWLKVSDTGPGLPAGPGASIATGLIEATASARESDATGAASKGKASQVLKSASGELTAEHAPDQHGEGIGLSIVKRLCELLDASMEVASSAATGTTFRIVLPRRYTVSSKRPKLRRKRG